MEKNEVFLKYSKIKKSSQTKAHTLFKYTNKTSSKRSGNGEDSSNKLLSLPRERENGCYVTSMMGFSTD